MVRKIKSIIVFLVVIILAAAVIFFILKIQTKKVITIDMTQPQAEMTDLQVETKETTQFNPISIRYFSEKNFDGSDFKVGEILDRELTYTKYYITYESAGLTISGIMNVPQGKGPFPVLFLNHGYIDPEVYTNGRGLKREQDYLARQGYIIIHSDYRNHAGSDKEADVNYPDLRFGYAEDVINGIEAFKKANLNYADTEKIGMLGHSMGGGIAEIIAVSKPNLVKAIVLFAPVSADQKDSFEKWTEKDPERRELTIENYGSPKDNPDFWRNASPIYFFDKVQVPIIFHHGKSDAECDLKWSQRAVATLQASGKDATLYSYPGEGHEFAKAWPQVMKISLDFFDKHVKNKS